MTQRKLTDAEIIYCKFQYHILGGFLTSLVVCISRADDNNKKLLSKSFPELVEVVYRYQNQYGYWEEIDGLWNEYLKNEKQIL